MGFAHEDLLIAEAHEHQLIGLAHEHELMGAVAEIQDQLKSLPYVAIESMMVIGYGMATAKSGPQNTASVEQGGMGIHRILSLTTSCNCWIWECLHTR